MLIAKQLGYRIFGMYGDRLTWHDLLNGALSKTDQIPRHEHAGFDDRQMVKRIARYFDVTESAGLFVPYFTTLNFTLGIVGTAKQPQALSGIYLARVRMLGSAHLLFASPA